MRPTLILKLTATPTVLFDIQHSFIFGATQQRCVKDDFSTNKKQRILFFASWDLKSPAIAKELQKEGLKCSRYLQVLKKYEATGSIRRRVGSGHPSKVTAEIKEIVERQMRTDDKTAAYQLHSLLTEKGYSISLHTTHVHVLHCRTALGWGFSGSAYCQLIQETNKAKRFASRTPWWFLEDVIWTDECTVQMESHRRFICRKLGEAPHPKPRYIL